MQVNVNSTLLKLEVDLLMLFYIQYHSGVTFHGTYIQKVVVSCSHTHSPKHCAYVNKSELRMNTYVTHCLQHDGKDNKINSQYSRLLVDLHLPIETGSQLHSTTFPCVKKGELRISTRFLVCLHEWYNNTF